MRGVQQGQLLSSLPVAPGAQASSAQFARGKGRLTRAGAATAGRGKASGAAAGAEGRVWVGQQSSRLRIAPRALGAAGRRGESGGRHRVCCQASLLRAPIGAAATGAGRAKGGCSAARWEEKPRRGSNADPLRGRCAASAPEYASARHRKPQQTRAATQAA